MAEEPERLRVLQYNLLLEELGTNFVPRTMRDPDEAILIDAFGGLEPAEAKARWAALKQELSDEYKKWHPLKELVLCPDGAQARVRALWDKQDLLELEKAGWDLAGLPLQSATQLGDLGGKSGAPRTLLGMLAEALGSADRSQALYDSIRAVHESAMAWSVRGYKVMEKIRDSDASLVVVEEYDMHEMPTAGFPSFKAAMESLGYDGASFRGPGQGAAGVGIFWKAGDVHLPGGASLPEDRVLRAGDDFGFAANLDFEEPGFKEADRRSLAMVRLQTPSGRSVLLCGVHMMTISRDKSGRVRAYELARIREMIGDRADEEDAVLLCGDFNTDIRNGREEHVLRGLIEDEEGSARFDTGWVRDAQDGSPMLKWRRSSRTDGRGSDLTLLDAFGDVNHLPESTSTVTGCRRETVDYIFYDERLSPVTGTRTSLSCPDAPMPNDCEPSDHVPLAITMELTSSRAEKEIPEVRGSPCPCEGNRAVREE